MDKEFNYKGLMVNGFLMLLITFVIIPIVGVYTMWQFIETESLTYIIVAVVMFILFFFCASGLVIQQPNVARTLIFFGKYTGTFRKTGYYWVNPLMTRIKISLRIRNMDIEPIKVNDKVGNPVMIGMVLVWRIKDTYKVVFDLDAQLAGGVHGLNNAALDHFVRIQSDAALREVTGQFAYDRSESRADEITLLDGGEKINDLLEQKINERLAIAGVEVVEARLNYLAYAPEIAAVMLRRQQASAIITAREKIVEGAVSMVDMALNRIEEKGLVKLDDEKRAAMVSNLLVVLCADEAAQPVLNTNA